MRREDASAENNRPHPTSLMQILQLFLILYLFTFARLQEPDAIANRPDAPLLLISVHVVSPPYPMSYFFGWLENQYYPKSRTAIQFISTEGSEATENIQRWAMHSDIRELFRSIHVESSSSNTDDDALELARSLECDLLLLLDAEENLPVDLNLIHHLMKYDGIVSLNVLPVGNTLGNFEYGKAVKVDNYRAPCLLRRDEILGSEVPTYLIDIKGAMLSKNDLLPGKLPYLIANCIINGDLSAELHSSIIPVNYPQKSTFGFDKIYVINLWRRNDRRIIVQRLADVLGMEITFLNATDARDLPMDIMEIVKPLDGYLDPYLKRPLTSGEVACFLSHYRIWEDVIKNGYKQVWIMEDDPRFSVGALDTIKRVFSECESQNVPWDFIFSGRKLMGHKDGNWIPGVENLIESGYVYWLMSYHLSLSGAKKLLANDPLRKLIPTDEYVPVMADVSPYTEWARHYENRTLELLAIHPSVVEPQWFTRQAKHHSDTENSDLFQ